MPLTPTIGQIMPVAFNSPQNIPKGWVLCDGSLLIIQTNQALFSLLGTQYGGDGRTTFGVPDLRGRAIMGALQQSYMGMKQGTPTVTVTEQQMPSHTHFLAASTTSGSGRPTSPTNRLFGINTSSNNLFALTGSAEVLLAKGTNVQPTGSSQPHDNMQPYLAINYMIATQGVFPTRG